MFIIGKLVDLCAMQKNCAELETIFGFTYFFINIIFVFRKLVLNSTNELDNIIPLPENWEETKGIYRLENVRHNYIGVHWRRADFLRAHAEHVPSIQNTAKQV